MSDYRTIEEMHAARESGSGCPGVADGRHYFAFLDGNIRFCIDCGAEEVTQ